MNDDEVRDCMKGACDGSMVLYGTGEDVDGHEVTWWSCETCGTLHLEASEPDPHPALFDDADIPW